MDILYIIIIAVFGTALLICALLLGLALFIKWTVFGHRSDKNPLLTYFTAEDFGLSAKQVDIATCGEDGYIRGVIYKNEGVTPKGDLVIFCHGMGPGHVAYTTEIAYFCNLGYTVLAPDYEGCNLSDGNSIKGFKNGIHTAIFALLYATENLNWQGKIYLVGHSWGAYSALCAAAETGLADKVVAISAPDKPENAIFSALSDKLPKLLAEILYPFIALVCGGKSAAEAAEEINVPTLLIHGEKDNVVPPENAAFCKANGTHVSKYLAKDKCHNPYNTVQAEGKLAELSASLSKINSGEVAEDYFKNFDYKAATEEDSEVMGEIARFLSENVN